MAGALLAKHFLEGRWDSGFSPRHCPDAALQAEAAVLLEVPLFAAVGQRKLYSQLLSTHETFVDVLLSRGIPDRGILPCAGESSASLKPGAKLAAVILQEKSCGYRAAYPPDFMGLILRNLGFPAREALSHHKNIPGEPGCG